ncbi:uncharacterized protein LOC132724257 [Ruditapes philippinarum]|uniref:uncharacterized protein LOC132724257 n=1 Tax=Ruditapes philippinarum TaxID=129788 RepID=UPI00295C0FAB|nr:uncharacterized protein LOC132724257 [Ruditapes philippinarum]
MKTTKHVYIVLLWILQTFTDLRTTNAATTPTSITNLSCYDCSESFKYIWEPYTACQYYPQSTPLRPCLGVERYCKVERVTYKSVTVSITRSCTQQCWHGCYASGFGLTKLKCTSCCLEAGCNVGDAADNIVPGIYLIFATLSLFLIIL